jgi:hypothetical protein
MREAQDSCRHFITPARNDAAFAFIDHPGFAATRVQAWLVDELEQPAG